MRRLGAILGHRLAAVLLLWVWLGPAAPAAAQAPGGWQEIETRHAVICYRRLADLTALNARIRYFPKGVAVTMLAPPANFDSLSAVLARKVDALYERAQEILDMRRRLPRVTIRVYADRQALGAAFTALFDAPCHLRAWYLFERRSVYVTVEDVNEGMLAHEMGHHIIDHFFKVRPPANTAEILARYIDAHLFSP